MGSDKSLLPFDGVAMAVRVSNALTAAGCTDVVAIGGDAPALAALGLTVIADEFPGEGPLGGVITALDHFPSATAVMIAACDLPLLTSAAVGAVLASLGAAEVAIATTDRPQPLCSAWRPSVAARLRTAFSGGERRLQAVLATLETRQVPVDHQELTNHNTPGDVPH